jgi:mannose-6-phosphate isomerase
MILKSKPIFSPRPWGDRLLNELYKVDTQDPVGEVWLLSDFQGMRTEMYEGERYVYPADLTETLFHKDLPRFPLLVKYICANDWLSVQVHPDDGLAKLLESEPWGKNECWYFLQNGRIAAGITRPGKPLEDLRSGDLRILTPERGDLVCLQAGTVHSLGPGSKVIEVQQASDMTYRIHDWGRGRELHLDKARVVTKAAASAIVIEEMKKFSWKYFSIELARKVEGSGIVITLSEVPELHVLIDDREEFPEDVLLVRPGSFWSESL